MLSRHSLLAVLALTAAPLSACADIPLASERPSGAEVRALIAQLGDSRFAVRKSASEKLARIGLPAYHALEDATRDGDREIRYRAEKVLSLIRQNDLNRRLTIFLAALDTPEDKSLPSWTRFKAAHGNSPASRALFVEMQRAEGELLAQLESDPRQATEWLGKRAAELTIDQQIRAKRDGTLTTMSLGQLASLFFVAGEADVKPSPHTLAIVLNLGDQPALREALIPLEKADKNSAPRGDISRRMLATVISRSEDVAAYPAMLLAERFDLKEGLVPALKVLDGPGRVRVMDRAALSLVAKLGDKSHLPLLEKLFADNTSLGTSVLNRVRREIQVRDSALAAAVLITKQDLKGYFDFPDSSPETRGLSYSYLSLGFENEDQRTAAFQKWESYRATIAKKPNEVPAPAPGEGK